VVTGSWDKTAKLWEVSSGKLLHNLPGQHQICELAWPTRRMARPSYLAAPTQTAKLWEVSSGQLLHTFEGHTSNVKGVVYAPDGKTILTGSDDGTAKLWDATSGQLLHTLKGHIRSVEAWPTRRTARLFSQGV